MRKGIICSIEVTCQNKVGCVLRGDAGGVEKDIRADISDKVRAASGEV